MKKLKHFDITPKWQIKENSDIYSTNLSNDNSNIAIALGNGHISIRSSLTGRLSYDLIHSKEEFPITGIKYNPILPKTFLSISTDGKIQEWNSINPKKSWLIKEENNQLYALDINSNGIQFSTGGTDTKIRIYDLKIKKCISELFKNPFDYSSQNGHTDRIYCVIFNKNDQNMLLSGGWDNTIQIWDLRNNISSLNILGPHICGNSIDINGNYILTGSWRTYDQIQLWDIRNGKLIKSTSWNNLNNDKQCLVYFSQFISNGSHFIIGGSDVNQIKIYYLDTFTSQGSSITLQNSPFCSSISKDSSFFITGTSNGLLSNFSIV